MTNLQGTRVQLEIGIFRESYENEHLTIYTGVEATRATIDAWVADAILQFSLYQPGQTYAVLYDFSHPNAVLTPYARSRALEIARLVPKNTMNYAALVVRGGIIGQAYQLFVRGAGNAPHLQTRAFFNRDDALKWLRERLNQARTKAG